MATKENPGEFDCYEHAKPDEPLFVLLARDPNAADLVRLWAAMRQQNVSNMNFTYNRMALRVFNEKSRTPNVLKVLEATDCANDMDAWRKANPDA